MYTTRLRKYTFALVLLIQFGLVGQVSHGGQPLSMSNPDLNSGVPLSLLTPPNVNLLLLEDVSGDANGDLLRDAVVLALAADLDHNGVWFTLPTGDRVWKFSIKAPGALSLELYFDDFYMPPGGRLYVLNQDMSEYLGAFNEGNNKNSNRFCVSMVKGEVIHLEYYEPISQVGLGRISLLDVGYRYRDVIGFNDVTNSGISDCQVEVACTEGNDWTNEAKSVMRIRSRVNGQLFWSTGTLLNNTAVDCSPYVLTAMSTSLKSGFQSSDSDFDFYRFHFGNESESCDGSLRSEDLSIVGSVKLGDSNDDGGETGSDYLLLEISTEIPNSFNPYYAGWNAEDVVDSNGGVGIHYPFADSKCINTFSTAPQTSGWQVSFTHWRAFWETTENGHGIMELGSIGAPIFNSQGQVIGTYTGGSSSCDNPNSPDFFGKMSWHWQENPNPPSEKLKALLDPFAAGNLSVSGSSNPCNVPDAIEELENLNFSIHPNPSSGVLNVDFVIGHGNGYNLQIYNMLGESVLFFPSASPGILDISSIQPGVYLVSIIAPNGSSLTRKLVMSK